MRQTWLIAWHGFVQHVTSRPFMLGVMLPLFYLVLVGLVPSASQQQLALLGAPVRHFAMIDETGVFMGVVDRAIAQDNEIRSAATLIQYARENIDPETLKEKSPELARIIFDSDPDSPRATTAIRARGGVTQVFVELRPFLNPGAPRFVEPSPRFYRVELPEELQGSDDILKAAQPYLSAERLIRGPFGPIQLWAILVIPKDFAAGTARAAYLADDLNRPGLREFLRIALDNELKRKRATGQSVPEAVFQDIFETAGEIESLDPEPDRVGAVTGVRQLRVVAANVIYFMLFFAVFMTANMVVMALVEEKSNRVAELLLSCVRAETLMAGKLFTGLMLALFLVCVWVFTVTTAVDYVFPAGKVLVAQLLENLSGAGQVFQLAVFFALSYLTIGAFLLAAGSAANSISDAQAVVAPATLVTMPVCMLPLAIAYAPDSLFARFASYVPFFSPFTMMVRSLGEPDGIDVLGAFVVSALTLWWLIRVVARVFRANLLRPDSPASFRGFIRDLFRTRRTA